MEGEGRDGRSERVRKRKIKDWSGNIHVQHRTI